MWSQKQISFVVYIHSAQFVGNNITNVVSQEGRPTIFRLAPKNIGIEEIKTVGEKFNPELHHAVSKEKVEGKESGTILEEVGAGYKMHDKVIEPAKVKVAEWHEYYTNLHELKH